MSKILIGNVKGPKGDPGDVGPAGPNTVPTNQAIADAVSQDGPARDEMQRTFVAFQKEDGTPLVAKRVIITVSNDGTSIADIKVVN